MKTNPPAEATPDQSDPQVEDEAEYTLESSAKCPLCGAILNKVAVVRLLRTKVNFTSSLPRRGCVAICPSCRGIIPVSISSRLA